MKNIHPAHFGLLIYLSLVTLSAKADQLTSALSQIETNNHEIHLAVKELAATMAENSTGLSPEGPEIELGYLWGEKGIGDRKDIAVSQSFDFPTVYGKRAALARQKDLAAQRERDAKRLAVLLEAKETLIQAIHANALCDYWAGQTETSRHILENYKRLEESRNATLLEVNKARIALAEAENSLLRETLNRDMLMEKVEALNGGKPLAFTQTVFPKENIPADFETWWNSTVATNPRIEALRAGIEAANREMVLAAAERLPRFSLGYQGEFVKDGTFQGITLGVSLPLWQNRNKKRAAALRKEVIEEEITETENDMRHTMQGLWHECTALDKLEKEYAETLESTDASKLLSDALEGGRINMLEYLTELQYYNAATQRLLELRRDRALAAARLLSVGL